MGFLILHGGGTTAAATTRALIERAGGPDALIVVLPQSSADPAAKGKGSADWLRENGAKNVAVCEIARREDPALRDLPALLAKARGVWMPGGDQNRVTALFGGTPVPGALRDVLKRGGAVGGSSAGASLVGERMPTGDGDRTKLTANSVATAPGLDLLRGTLVDTHLLKRERTQRLLNMTLSHPSFVGIGLDENAWAEIDGDRRLLTVRGGQVLVARTGARVRSLPSGETSCETVRFRVLAPGDAVALDRI